ncbi:hypothetical protein DWB85_12570 [Seongchinamella sediminis]|uniref:Uncharacterized protein n=1 Tax=Seongchinamella sediminis TaxID=2283635 RepID=A0A3L7DXW2_9GAMM|nr:hypothetical protein [Seongchinamella sediminis]RLQ21360.1 hypothetical protein DWB85_12570 [Seongchinamella sediminis]
MDKVKTQLENGDTVVIVGGGPAGSFTALHLLERAQRRHLELNVLVFERRLGIRDQRVAYSGCPQCAGGVSPRLHDALEALQIRLPPAVIQAPINTIILQGRWKHLPLKVPDDRTMLSVYRGTLPRDRGPGPRHKAFDALLLEIVERRGATIVSDGIKGVARDHEGKPVLAFQEKGRERTVVADFVVFATGVNPGAAAQGRQRDGTTLFIKLCPGYQPPGLRKALIFELLGPGGGIDPGVGELHYIESTEAGLDLVMCSILPKAEHLTVSLIGRSVDRAVSHQDNLEVIRRFLAVPRIRRSLPADCSLTIRCACNPCIVVGSARHPTGERVAAVGDLVTCRQYKDGILSAHSMARSLAATLVDEGLDRKSLRRGYGRTLNRFRRDNHYARIIFALYRIFFCSRFLSRVLYQTYSSEQKRKPHHQRHFERILWAISSGDESYRRILGRMLAPRTLWQIFSYGLLVTLRASFWEAVFDLRWRGLGRFPVVVDREQKAARLAALPDLQAGRHTYLYSIEVKRTPMQLMPVLERFGEPDRPFLRPRMVNIQRRQGSFHRGDAIVDYRIFGGLLRFAIVQVPAQDTKTLNFKVHGGFADQGNFLFQIEPLTGGRSRLSVLLSYNYPMGKSLPQKAFWRTFSLLFPEAIHEIIWNHALCELKQAAEQIDPDIITRVPARLTS